MQNKKLSAVEAITNTVSGLVISFIIQIIIYPFLDIEVTLDQNLFITFVFFVVSFVRGYIVRRFFNRLKEKREDAE
tara:strand:+ start:1176 stop:1403 length:228 start_codon:yes stop_codon:yes gene_type:complete